MKELSANELKDLMSTMKDLVLIDVREEWEVKVANIDNSTMTNVTIDLGTYAN